MPEPDAAALARLDAFLATVRARAVPLLASGKRRELHVVVVVEAHQVTPASHVVTKDYPLDGNGS